MMKECRKYKAWKEKSEKENKATTDKDNFCFNIRRHNNLRELWFGYVDLDATSHMTSSREFFDEVFRNVEDKVTVTNGKKVKVMGVGSGKSCYDENIKRIVT